MRELFQLKNRPFADLSLQNVIFASRFSRYDSRPPETRDVFTLARQGLLRFFYARIMPEGLFFVNTRIQAALKQPKSPCKQPICPKYTRLDELKEEKQEKDE